jgi:hypothetical protein
MDPRVAVDPAGGFVVLWYGPGDATGGILYARRFRPGGEPATGDIQVADQVVTTNENVEVALQDDGSFLALFSVSGALKLRRFSPDGVLLREVRVATGVPYVPGASLSSRGDGRLVVAWRLFNQGVFARVYDRDGDPLGPRITVERTSQPKYGPFAAMGPRGEFVVVWQALLGVDPAGTLLAHIEARRYGPGSRPRGEKILVSDHFGGGIHAVKDGAGNFLVTWIELPTFSGLQGIYGRRFSAAGLPASAATPLVPSFTTGYTDLAMTPEGSFVLVWESLPSLDAQVFTAGGVAPRPAFQVAGPPLGTNFIPRVAIDGVGRFVVVWQRGDIFGQRFKARRP